MKKHLKTIIILCLVSVVIVAGFFAVNWIFNDIQRLHGQEIIVKSDSPNHTYTVTAYLNNGGMTVDFAVLATVTDHSTGKTRNIYWQYHCQEAEITWADDETVNINGVSLNVLHDTYDYRNK